MLSPLGLEIHVAILKRVTHTHTHIHRGNKEYVCMKIWDPFSLFTLTRKVDLVMWIVFQEKVIPDMKKYHVNLGWLCLISPIIQRFSLYVYITQT